MSTISVWDYLSEYQAERDEILSAVDTVFKSGQLVLGESVRGFEREFARFLGTSHCVGVDNGTNAVKLALESVGIGPGDEVITVSNTAAPTVLAIEGAGAVPVFVDVLHDDYLMDVAAVEAAVTRRTRAIVVVHLYGQCVDMAPLTAVAEKNKLLVIEDCAQAHAARHHGRLAGTFGAAGAFSFYPTKVLGAYGDGGAVVTADDTTADELRKLRYYGMQDVYYVVRTPGHNSRLDELHAEILRRKLVRLHNYVADRRAVAQRYADALGDTELETPVVSVGNEHVYYVYVVRHPDRDRILAELADRGIRLNVSYPWPVHTMTGFEHLGYRRGSLPVTEDLAGQIFSLPMYPSLSQERQDRVISALREVIGVDHSSATGASRGST
ncbi:daunorubicin biosynthesis sensory transduction protein DnrJ (plasmid) [Pseudonocardia sp. EC080610-09]|uniref:DegT/DnrJ/EryC1/StrS family aminotransferase n=1 Tax=unclassified Pseudonocardia TaxID=2619320 RepID=UPI0007068205|nr:MULTISPECIES: DegT/DnrJ/EryC1/StrS family aminotransferase [unclassified Pseudonocardia]ALL79486.1 daunorubicin biosynthesis sensory transduction protein DnrJ [Pseudonocardia sp. EC080610-09]ALL85561.1 daunorubicin biosynthesis sensory transduction protein DnrJ [Pseudonocardia sp. EC080619-01]